MLVYILKFKIRDILIRSIILLLITIPIIAIEGLNHKVYVFLFYLWAFAFVFYFSVYQSFELHDSFLKINRKIWLLFLKPQVFSLSSIYELNYFERGSNSRFPYFEIKVMKNNKLITYTYYDSLFSFKDIKVMFHYLETLNVKVNIINK